MFYVVISRVNGCHEGVLRKPGVEGVSGISGAMKNNYVIIFYVLFVKSYSLNA